MFKYAKSVVSLDQIQNPKSILHIDMLYATTDNKIKTINSKMKEELKSHSIVNPLNHVNQNQNNENLLPNIL